jgi:hypothetical protein
MAARRPSFGLTDRPAPKVIGLFRFRDDGIGMNEVAN